MTITIHGQTPSHKNSKQIFRTKYGRTILANNDRYLIWRTAALAELSSQKNIKYSRCNIIIDFIVKDNRKRDLDNMAASIMDVLVGAGVIEDDNCFLIPKIELNFLGVDKYDPLARIYISEVSRE